MTRRPTVYVSAAGTATAYALIRSIRQHLDDSVFLIVGDSNPPELVAASRLADAATTTPLVEDPAFAPHITALLQEHEVDIYLPILDDEILFAATLREEGRLPDTVNVLAPPPAAAAVCLDKLEAAVWLETTGLPGPETVLAAEASWGGQPLFAKTRRGFGSCGARPIETEDDLVPLRHRRDMVVQERCLPPEVTVDCYRSSDGALSQSLCRERLEVKAGVCTKARIFVDDELAQIVQRIGMELPLAGGYCVQLMVSPRSGTWVVTDINPRIGAGTAMSVAVGFDPGLATIATALGLDPGPYLQLPDGQSFVVRTYQEWVTCGAGRL